MPRPATFSLVVLLMLGLAACSKKQEPTPPAAEAPTAPADQAGPAATAGAEAPTQTSDAPREFDFSGRLSNTGPTSGAPAVQTGEPEAAPDDTITVQMPVMVEYYPPFYPIAERMKGAEGRFLVGLFVTETGAVEAPEILSSTVPAYGNDVLEAVRHWRFLPALHEGKPIRFPVRIPVSYVSEFGTGGMPAGSPLENLVLVDGIFYVVSDDGRYTCANLDVTPITRVQPAYQVPENVSELRVTVRFRVNEEGRVVDPVVDESSGTDFDQAALKAVSFWQFLPKIRDGKAVTAPAKLPLRISR